VLPVLHLAILLEGRRVEDLTVDNLSAVMYLKNQASEVSLRSGASGGIRAPDPLLRSRSTYFAKSCQRNG